MAEYTEIADRLRILRGRLSQREFAKSLGISFWSYATYEKGMRPPSYELLVGLKQVYDVASDWILFGEENRGERVSLPERKKEEMLLTFGYRCAWCNFGMSGSPFLEICHLEPIQEERETNMDNLVVLCPNCHKLFTQGVIPLGPLRLKREQVLIRAAEKAQYSDLLPKRRHPKKRTKR